MDIVLLPEPNVRRQRQSNQEPLICYLEPLRGILRQTDMSRGSEGWGVCVYDELCGTEGLDPRTSIGDASCQTVSGKLLTLESCREK